MNRHTSHFIAAFGLLISTTASQAAFIGPSPYLCFDGNVTAGCTAGTNDSPFASEDFGTGYFHLEDFEDGLANSTGMTATGGAVAINISIIDSVDEDTDGVNGSGLAGASYFSASGSAGVGFSCDAGVLGLLPTHVGVVWTDGAFLNEVTFEAFDAANNSIGTLVAGTGNPPTIGDNSFNGGTAEDRFFGLTHAAGIARIHMRNSVLFGGGSGIEVDHVQYGNPTNQNANPAPEPAALLLVGIGLAGVAWRQKRRVNSIASRPQPI